MAGKGGGAWKVAYADFVTAMMAFFLVMWITAQSNAMKQSIAKYFQHPYEATSRSPIATKSSSGSSLIPTTRGMEGSTPHATSKGKSARGGGMITDTTAPPDAKAPKTGGLRKRTGLMLRNSDDTGIGTIIQFPGDSTALDEQAKRILDELIPRFVGKLNKVEIRGHTSSQAPTTVASDDSATDTRNMWQLSYDRCLAAMKYLEAHGIDPKRIRLSQAGIFEPSIEDDPAGRAPSSRVEIYLLNEFADDYLSNTKAVAKKEESPIIGERRADEPSTGDGPGE